MSTSAPADAAERAPYATRGSCAGWPRAQLKTPPGWCVALLADAGAGLRFPRRVLEVAPGRFWLVDMGSWEPSRGRVLEFALTPGALPTFTVLADKLDRPLGLVKGPDGRVWIGEAGRVSRTPVGAPGTPLKLETVIDRLPADGAHPLKELAFSADGKLYVNVGSTSDACRDAANALPFPCPELAPKETPRAAVYEATFAGAGFALQSLRPFATGLRNSVALAVAGRTVLQGENSIDYADAGAPPEELNVLRAGAFYGWPYCVGAGVAARGYEGRFDCARSTPPTMRWPAHAAPLQLVVVPADVGHAFAGQLVVAWHGYRAGGHRVVSYALDVDGVPTGAPRAWVDGWDAAPGVRPLGAPAGIAVDAEGRLLIVEDRHRTLLMLTRDAR